MAPLDPPSLEPPSSNIATEESPLPNKKRDKYSQPYSKGDPEGFRRGCGRSHMYRIFFDQTDCVCW